jgi:hypothetical protein
VRELFYYRDGELYWKVHKPHTKKDKPAGYLSKKYKIVSINYKNYLNHRIIFLWHHGYIPKEIDHIDRNSLNNKIENLREATRSQNMFNKLANATNKTGIKNVVWSNEKKKYKVQINVNKKHIFLGYFNDIELAELTAIEARNKYHKEFARSN